MKARQIMRTFIAMGWRKVNVDGSFLPRMLVVMNPQATKVVCIKFDAKGDVLAWNQEQLLTTYSNMSPAT